MQLSYSGLWKILIDKNMNKSDLEKATGVSHSTIAKMSKGQPVSMRVLITICKYLDSDIGDLVTFKGVRKDV